MGTAAQRLVDSVAGTRQRPVLRLLGAETAAELAGRVTTVRELGRRREEARRGAFATGLPPFDRLLDGGLPRGVLVELVGRSSGGRFSIALAALATATAAGEAAALVDRGDHLDPQAAEDLGVDLRRLLWLRPRDVQETLAAAETVLAAGFPLVVVDLGLPPLAGGRGAEAGWLRLARAAQTHGAALLVVSPYRVSGTAAHTVITARPAAAVYPPGPPLLSGLAAHLELEKARGRRGGDQESLELRIPGAAEAAEPEDAEMRAAGPRNVGPRAAASRRAAPRTAAPRVAARLAAPPVAGSSFPGTPSPETSSAGPPRDEAPFSEEPISGRPFSGAPFLERRVLEPCAPDTAAAG